LNLKRIVVIEGDGIGAEVVPQAVRALRSVAPEVELVPAEMGLRSKERLGSYLPDATMDAIHDSDACLFGAITTPDDEQSYRSPILRLRCELELYANVRPAKRIVPDIGMVDLNLVLVRENSEGMYTGMESEQVGAVVLERKISDKACRRICRKALDICESEKIGRITCVHKANVLRKSDGMFRRIFYEEAAGRKVEARDMLVDAAAAALINKPQEFGCIVTLNLYGDILSDEAAALVGGLGMAPSGNIGDHYAIFEPCHGSAPDIAGRGIANPTAAVLSASMLLKHLGMPKGAKLIEDGVKKTLERGIRTPDIGGRHSTKEFGNSLIAMIEAEKK
jgi:isopropylmalate/isohomocitrate dehydrogenase-like protein